MTSNQNPLNPIFETMQFHESAAVQVAVQKIEMIRDNPAGLESSNFFGTGAEHFRRAIENGRGLVRMEKVAGHHVAAEQQIMFGTIEATVAHRVTGEMNHFQPA